MAHSALKRKPARCTNVAQKRRCHCHCCLVLVARSCLLDVSGWMFLRKRPGQAAATSCASLKSSQGIKTSPVRRSTVLPLPSAKMSKIFHSEAARFGGSWVESFGLYVHMGIPLAGA